MEVYRKSWDEFRDTGLLMFTNQFLHIFGWAIVIDVDESGNCDIYPARVRVRGFTEQSQEKNYLKLTKYMKCHVNELLADQGYNVIDSDKDFEPMRAGAPRT